MRQADTAPLKEIQSQHLIDDGKHHSRVQQVPGVNKTSLTWLVQSLQQFNVRTSSMGYAPKQYPA